YTYRMGAHTTSDDPTRYRSRAEEQYWRDRDPLTRIEALLKAEDGWDETWARDLADEADALGEHVRTSCRAMPAPAAASMFEHVYATDNAVVEADRAWFADYEQSFEEAR